MNNKVQFSKILTILSAILFIWCLLEGFNTHFGEVYDTTVYVTSITVSGSIFGLCLKSYMSKAKAENIYKVQHGMYEDIMNIKLKYNERMMQLTQEYQMTQSDVDMVDMDSPINDGVNDIMNDMRENVNNHLYDTKMEDDIENF
jgi:membrane protein insertase Oxa1/YidC/SpoIIIJ